MTVTRPSGLELPISHAALIPAAVSRGFTFHHSGDGYLMMTCELVEGTYLPPFATHYIGIGGVVLTAERELLVVREKYGFGGRPPTLKLPGGALQPENTWSKPWRERCWRDRGEGHLRGYGLLPPLAWLPLRQVRHLLRRAVEAG